MMSNRRLSTISGWMLCGILLWCSISASAQSRLDTATVSNTNFWSPDERRLIESFVGRQFEGIQSGNEAAIDDGRSSLIEQPRIPGASDRFNEQYAELVSGRLNPLMQSDALKIRLNAMVVAMSLPHPNALGAINQGLRDESAGVRYPAARAIGALLATGQLSDGQTQSVLDDIRQMIVEEDEVYVVQPLFDAMLAAPDIDEMLIAIDVLNQRLERHAEAPEISFAPESTALQEIYSRLITAAEADRPPAEVRELARASSRYLLVAAQQLADGVVPEDYDASHKDIVRVAATALEFAHGDLRSNEIVPASVERPITIGDWAAVVRIGESWSDVLKAAPFNYTDADLDI